jgi:hypothetical protein
MRPNLIRTELEVYLKVREELIFRSVASYLKRNGVENKHMYYLLPTMQCTDTVEKSSVIFTIIEAVFSVNVLTLKRIVQLMKGGH